VKRNTLNFLLNKFWKKKRNFKALSQRLKMIEIKCWILNWERTKEDPVVKGMVLKCKSLSFRLKNTLLLSFLYKNIFSIIFSFSLIVVCLFVDQQILQKHIKILFLKNLFTHDPCYCFLQYFLKLKTCSICLSTDKC